MLELGPNASLEPRVSPHLGFTIVEPLLQLISVTNFGVCTRREAHHIKGSAVAIGVGAPAPLTKTEQGKHGDPPSARVRAKASVAAAIYDRAITLFSPDGNLFQVQYAEEAVQKGSAAIAVRGADTVVVGVERRSIAKLQDERTVRKICVVDDHISMTFAGLTADARVLVDRAQLECQSHRLTVEDPPTVEYIAGHIAGIQQKFTQSGGRRPFGVSVLLVGFDDDGTPRLYQTSPAGTHTAWKANAIGHNSKTVREYLEKTYKEEDVATENGTIKLAIKALLEVVQSGSKSMEIAVLKHKEKMRILDSETIDELVKVVEIEKAAEAEKEASSSKTSS
eukprot:UC4_evm4s639